MDSLGRNGSIPIIDSKFCMPHAMHLIVKPKKKIFRRPFFIVLDTNGNQLLKIVKENSFNSKNRILLDATDSPVATLCHKSFSWHDVWRVYRGKNTNDNDGLFRVRRKNGITLKVFLGSKSNKDDKKKKSDFEIVGFPPTFYMGDTILSDVNNNFSWGEDGMKKGFKIRVNAGIDYAFIICLTIIHGEMAKSNRASGSTTEAVVDAGVNIAVSGIDAGVGGGGCGGGGGGGGS